MTRSCQPFAECFFLTLCGTFALTGCAALKPPTPQTPAEAEALKIVERDLQVIPIFEEGGSSGFPISKRNAVMAAHALYGGSDFVSVAAAPMISPQYSGTRWRKKPVEPKDDWVVVHAREDRFTPNIIDPTVKLRAGDLVFIGGFPIRPPTHNWDPVEHAQRKPEIMTGRVLTPSYSDTGPCMVWLSGPTRDLHGTSGGPAAIVDDLGQVRVFGVFTRGFWPPLGLPCYMGVTRISQTDLDKVQNTPAPYPRNCHGAILLGAE